MNKVMENTGTFDVARIRADFPILATQVHGKPLVYLDNGASAQKPLSVIETVDHFYRHLNSNVHRGIHDLSARATTAYEATRGIAQRFLNAEKEHEIIITKDSFKDTIFAFKPI